MRIVVVAAFLGWGAHAFYGFARDDYPVRTIRVEGADVLEEELLVAESGITSADSVLLLDVEAVRERIEALPYVRSCMVARVHPDSVLISIKEREAVATLLVSNRMFHIDRACVVLRELSRGETHTGPFVTTPGLGPIDLGQQLDCPPLRAAVAVWQAFSRSKMAGDVTVSEIAAWGENDIRMYCDELPFEVRWGRKDFENQARRLDVLWDELGKDITCREYLDLRFGNDVVCL